MLSRAFDRSNGADYSPSGAVSAEEMNMGKHDELTAAIKAGFNVKDKWSTSKPPQQRRGNNFAGGGRGDKHKKAGAGQNPVLVLMVSQIGSR